jgi:hypothetical protein
MYCFDYTYPQLAIILVLMILLVLAIFWEFKDHERIKSRPYVHSIKTEKGRKKELEFHACFNAENNIEWRGIFIMTFVATLLVMYIIYQFYPDKCLDLNLGFLIFGAIILVFYIGNVFRHFHLYREMCAKVKKDRIIL